LTYHTITKQAGVDGFTPGDPLVTGNSYKVILSVANENGKIDSTNFG